MLHRWKYQIDFRDGSAKDKGFLDITENNALARAPWRKRIYVDAPIDWGLRLGFFGLVC